MCQASAKYFPIDIWRALRGSISENHPLSRGFKRKKRGCGQDNPILMSVHSNQIEADKNTMKGVDDEAADYELLWQRCSRYQ